MGCLHALNVVRGPQRGKASCSSRSWLGLKAFSGCTNLTNGMARRDFFETSVVSSRSTPLVRLRQQSAEEVARTSAAETPSAAILAMCRRRGH